MINNYMLLIYKHIIKKYKLNRILDKLQRFYKLIRNCLLLEFKMEKLDFGVLVIGILLNKPDFIKKRLLGLLVDKISLWLRLEDPRLFYGMLRNLRKFMNIDLGKLLILDISI
jgi:hypothetical protein